MKLLRQKSSSIYKQKAILIRFRAVARILEAH